MKFKQRLLAAITLTACAWPLAASAGFQWTESGPPGAGDSLSTAQVTYSATFETLDRITGGLTASAPDIKGGSPIYQVDLFKIRVADVSAFSAWTTGSTAFDTQLYLIDKDGKGVYTNDDNGLDLLSLLPAASALGPLSADIYYLAIAFGGYLAQDAGGASLFMSGGLTDVLGGDPSSGALAGWGRSYDNGNSEALYSYQIDLTGATNADLPEPGVFMLAAVALGAAGIARRRKSIATQA
ncbi:hypothetical protein J2X16_002581 [Pelomonas aquatica]|uniref:PEP-CTERM protein-sorting domain-containing protein n=1 Tax=Pelomonas aquatica TaxID=431058 RepID=A0ABU1Z9D3_9BURK|nr:PEP-CTERM sorting domain-containing protein [Pelomonas aquatica]MDR7297234.1 hypothetical protein [Pelomonas aquatica]